MKLPRKNEQDMNEYICACNVRVTPTLRHVSLLTLEDMLIPFLVVPTTVGTASATLAQCPDGARETYQYAIHE